jgi:two-component system, sensor histidine kinase and response regulator
MGNKTVLIVDDTISNLDILIGFLNEYDIIDTTNGKDALEIVDEEEVDLILLDIMMPEMDGFEVCKRLKNNTKTKNIPIIFITAVSEEESIEKAYDAGGVDYITKPFKPKELLARVKTQLNLQELQKKELSYQKQLSIAELIHNIAHQWRQPLSVISTLSSGLSMQKELGIISDKVIIEYSDKITSTAQYMSSVIEIFEKIFNNNITITKLDIKKVLETNFILTEEESLKIIIEIEDDLKITSSKELLIKVLQSLIENSREAFENGCEQIIFLNVKKYTDHILFEIYDTGGGVRSELLGRLFEPYFTTKHKSQEKGLGLYMVQNIVEHALLGSVEVENFKFIYDKNYYKGLKINIKLPLSI